MQFVLWNVHRVLCVDLQSLISHIRFKMSCDLADSLLTFEFLVFTKKNKKTTMAWFLFKVCYISAQLPYQ